MGVLPGLGPTATLALLLPITFHLTPVSAIIMLAGICYGAAYGGSTTSILLNIPGEPSSVVTCLDGYQMARKGRAGPALGISAFASFIAGTFSIFGLVLLAPTLADLALRFGPPEYFGLMIMGTDGGDLPGRGTRGEGPDDVRDRGRARVCRPGPHNGDAAAHDGPARIDGRRRSCPRCDGALRHLGSSAEFGDARKGPGFRGKDQRPAAQPRGLEEIDGPDRPRHAARFRPRDHPRGGNDRSAILVLRRRKAALLPSGTVRDRRDKGCCLARSVQQRRHGRHLHPAVQSGHPVQCHHRRSPGRA